MIRCPKRTDFYSLSFIHESNFNQYSQWIVTIRIDTLSSSTRTLCYDTGMAFWTNQWVTSVKLYSEYLIIRIDFITNLKSFQIVFSKPRFKITLRIPAALKSVSLPWHCNYEFIIQNWRLNSVVTLWLLWKFCTQNKKLNFIQSFPNFNVMNQ